MGLRKQKIDNKGEFYGHITNSNNYFLCNGIGNVLILYFMPDSKMGNGVAVFDSWHDVKKDEVLDMFAHYMAYWVAGVKLIFIFLQL